MHSSVVGVREEDSCGHYSHKFLQSYNAFAVKPVRR